VVNPKATGGSELVVREILNYINADLYALIFESSNPELSFKRQIGTTFLQHFRKPAMVFKIPAFVAVGD